MADTGSPSQAIHTIRNRSKGRSAENCLQGGDFLGEGGAVGATGARAATGAGTKVGIADNVTATTPVFDAPEHVKAAETATREENARR